LQEGVVDRIMSRTRFGRGCGPVVRESTGWSLWKKFNSVIQMCGARIVTRLLVWCASNRGSIPSRGKTYISRWNIQTCSVSPCFMGVMFIVPEAGLPGRKTDYWTPCTTEDKNEWSFTSTSPYAFIACMGTNYSYFFPSIQIRRTVTWNKFIPQYFGRWVIWTTVIRIRVSSGQFGANCNTAFPI
jgi:hypothetical protein